MFSKRANIIILSGVYESILPKLYRNNHYYAVSLATSRLQNTTRPNVAIKLHRNISAIPYSPYLFIRPTTVHNQLYIKYRYTCRPFYTYTPHTLHYNTKNCALSLHKIQI